jgi:imidazolonepropionase-like amidohydrolase
LLRLIKVVASGVVSLAEPEAVTSGGFGGDELRFIVDQAAGRGLGVMAHANGEQAVRDAVLAGVRSIEHGFFMTDDALAEMAKRRTFWVPTVGALRRAAEAAGPGEEMRRSIDRTIDRHLEMINKAFSLGVPLAVGTDAVLPDRQYGGWYQDELLWLRKAGIPEDAVHRIATEGGRTLLGIV